ncbi:MAG: hypothetical protein JNK65_04410 [Deltaproteobacteria bacterium]|nr:hypothetical protein [Deltaproteobacteria bacterium]
MRRLRNLAKILKFPHYSEKDMALSKKRMNPTVLRDLEKQLTLIDRDFPILEGAAHIDFLGKTAHHEFVLGWVFHRFGKEEVFHFLKAYEWYVKNKKIFSHVYFSNEKEKITKEKVYILSTHYADEIQPLFSYLKGIPIQFFICSAEGILDLPSRQDLKNSQVTRKKISRLQVPLEIQKATSLLSSVAPTSLNSDEVKDFMNNEFLASDDEDEITDPFVEISSLESSKEMSSKA